MERLPNELLSHILQYVLGPKDILSCMLTTWLWNHIMGKFNMNAALAFQARADKRYFRDLERMQPGEFMLAHSNDPDISRMRFCHNCASIVLTTREHIRRNASKHVGNILGIEPTVQFNYGECGEYLTVTYGFDSIRYKYPNDKFIRYEESLETIYRNVTPLTDTGIHATIVNTLIGYFY